MCTLALVCPDCGWAGVHRDLDNDHMGRLTQDVDPCLRRSTGCHTSSSLDREEPCAAWKANDRLRGVVMDFVFNPDAEDLAPKAEEEHRHKRRAK